jgi:hypothetical protein
VLPVPQTEYPEAQDSPQALALQVWPEAQAFPQVPQLLLSSVTLAQ